MRWERRERFLRPRGSAGRHASRQVRDTRAVMHAVTANL